MQATTITAEQMNDLMPYAIQYQQEKRDAAAQHEAELKAAEICPNYETTTERKTRKSAKKEVRIIARYAHKTNGQLNGNVSYLVLNGGGKRYCITISANGNTACTIYDQWNKGIPESCPSCKGGRKCYHIKACQKLEEARGWQIPAGKSLVRDDHHSEEREAALAAARAASEAELAKIEAETMAQIEREEAAEPVGKSEQARMAGLPFSDDEKKYSRWTEEMLAAPLNGNHQPVQAPATATASEQRLAAAGLLRR